MVTYAQVWAANPALWRTAGAAWSRLVAVVSRRSGDLGAFAGRVGGGWSGAAGRAAGRFVDDLRAPLDAGRAAFIEVDQILGEHARRLARAKGRLVAAVDAASAAHVEVDRRGRAYPVNTVTGIDRAAATRAADRVGTEIAAAIGEATASDRDTAERLDRLAAAASAGWPAEAPLGRPAVGASPAAVARWWAGLSEAERRWLVSYEPAATGRLDGIPVAARDQANRLLLAGQRADLMRQRTTAVHSGGTPSAAVAELHRLGALMSGFDAVVARLSSADGPRAYLMSLTPEDDGRMVLALGDPDRADNVLAYVPGMTAALAGIRDDLARTEAMATRAASVDPTQSTSTVLWLDYDAPDLLDQAAFPGAAREAGPVLHRFADGLRATHEAAPAHQTLLGHSYGSLVLGVAARDHGLDADSLVFVGSPGVGVDHADDLGQHAGSVWSSTASDDVIAYLAPGFGEIGNRLAQAAESFPLIPLPPPTPNEDLWFGRNPSHPEFGARVFHGDPYGHSGYWHSGNDALDDIARIALGPEHHDAVR